MSEFKIAKVPPAVNLFLPKKAKEVEPVMPVRPAKGFENEIKLLL